MPRELPLVSALVAAYNAEPYIEEALESAVTQDWPADRLEIIVVDDGSTDGTAAVVEAVAARHPGRITLIRQANAGACGATNTAFNAARGELVALLDADDAWPAGKLRAQTAVLAERPEVGLVYGDMTIIRADGSVMHESFLEDADPPSGRCLAETLFSNDCTASSVIFRRSLAEPIAGGVPYTDWWFAVRAAQVSELFYLPEPRTLYRFHGNNLTLGTEGPAKLREMRKAIAFRRWFLRRLEAGELGVQQFALVWRANDHNASEIVKEAGTPFAEVAVVSDADRAEAGEWLERGQAALRRGEPVEAAEHLSRAAACNPFLEAAREGLTAALAAAPGGAARAGQTPLEAAAGRVVLAYADELLERPELLARYVTEMAGRPDITLAIDASAMEPSTAEAVLGELVGSVPGSDDVDLLAVLGPLDVVGRARLDAGAHALLSERPSELAVPRL